ncbi:MULTISPECIES: peptide chain release factor N(5)-glutamine methyltransferase [unclassified Clostridioides]|uniref:peptide chain release factor N(5)-glutamine methyltransferase n=1 Tax=unclassified Clostridioides TaxID=2635829 RepID=UPI001D0FE484|nr:peptide chain release factor N(5)-glutamine methyltransferase [Clostridioides sp. ZZV14-6150]MCC0661689.1 peptide chain release factor N(5)-glutamine methyltransferase [Clostridioides sp. ZZV14-6154]MCC0669494.1 peptide chain release factor N(5)-glutamine methyltransferase [Clostridioides sp. ZZV14-6153]MCC0719227.1 peptide chain release factor N(5)-glutamine methyltransferase [Clostridioides sp. ZZV14-6105]MCC0723476.1 peptide chain release factor N(5)-glutamine methyltransferase [Clostridi
MTIKDIIIKYSEEFKDISDTPRLDTELLLQKALGDVDRLYIHLNLNKELAEEQKTKFIGFAEERINGRPIAYIVEKREFMGLDFFVKEGVLIPRPDTETLVEEIIEICKDGKNVSILDIGTGSGAITVSLAKYIENSNVTSFDISEIALEIGKKNAIINEVDEKIEYIKSDLFTALNDSNIKFDIIVSNPPYIKKQDIETLHTQVKDYEPYNALEGGEDGLDFYRKITEQGKKYLNECGILAYEVGHNQAEDVINIMKSNGYKQIYTKKDIQGIDRVVIGYNI